MAARQKNKQDSKLVAPVMKILATGHPTKFELEGACRAGLRSGFCLSGVPWEKSDNRAAWIVDRALQRLGSGRPSWEEGQREYVEPFAFNKAPARRFYCAGCGIPIEEGRAKYCSDECRGVAKMHAISAIRRRYIRGQIRAKWLAMLAANRQEALRERGVVCRHCGKTFVQKGGITGRYYCSDECYQAELAKPHTCVECGSEFMARERTSTRFCSSRCKLAAWRKKVQAEAEPKICEQCGSAFQPGQPDQRHCSRSCARKAQQRAARARKANGNGNGHIKSEIYSCADSANHRLLNLPAASGAGFVTPDAESTNARRGNGRRSNRMA